MATRAVPALHPFVGRDVAWLVDAQAARRPDQVCLAWEPLLGEGRVWSYAEFAEETRRYAVGLAERGVASGDFVLLHADNCPEFLFVWFACGRLGAVVVTTNTRSSVEELDYFIGHCGARVAITQPRYADLVRTAGQGRLDWIACTPQSYGQASGGQCPPDMLPTEALRSTSESCVMRSPQPLRPHSVQYTSGTTARPKGVVWTHANALWGASVTAAHLRLGPQDATPVYLPLFHTNALAYSTLPTLWAGGKVVLTPRFSASRFWDVVMKHDCTWASVTGFPLRALQGQPVPAHRLRLLGLGAGEHELGARLNSRSIGWFGMTETVSQCIMSDPELPGPPLSMGTPVPEYEVALRRDDGAPAAEGEIGHLLIRGTPGLSLFLEYLNNPQATEEAFDADGWFNTGDLAVARGGDIFFASRAKDMLKVSGENVAALEIETVILRVHGVREAAVVGRPDPMRDEVPVAFVVAGEPGPELEAAIMETCETALSDFKRPRQIIFVDELPKGTLDKVLKRELRDRLRAMEPVS